MLAPRPLPTSTPARVALAGLAALTALTGLSLLWAPVAGPAADDLQRLLLYLPAFAAGIALLRAPAAARIAEPLLLAGVAGATLYGLSERLLPGVVDLAARGQRRRPPRLPALLLERDGRLRGDRARAGRRAGRRPGAPAPPARRRGGRRAAARPRGVPDVLARRARRAGGGARAARGADAHGRAAARGARRRRVRRPRRGGDAGAAGRGDRRERARRGRGDAGAAGRARRGGGGARAAAARPAPPSRDCARSRSASWPSRSRGR